MMEWRGIVIRVCMSRCWFSSIVGMFYSIWLTNSTVMMLASSLDVIFAQCSALRVIYFSA